MFKIISITLPEKMIRRIDEALIDGEFSSRSDFFRHLINIWFQKSSREDVEANKSASASSKDEYADVDLEYGIPAEIVNKFEEMAKLKNK